MISLTVGEKLPENGTFEGFWKKGMKHGHGIFTWKSGATFEGEYMNGEKHGSGNLQMPMAASCTMGCTKAACPFTISYSVGRVQVHQENIH